MGKSVDVDGIEKSLYEIENERKWGMRNIIGKAEKSALNWLIVCGTFHECSSIPILYLILDSRE